MMKKLLSSATAHKLLQTLMVAAVVFASAPCRGKCYEPEVPEKLRK